MNTCIGKMEKDLFPGVESPRIGHQNFNDAVKHVLQTDKFVLIPDQVMYIKTVLVRFSVLVNRPQKKVLYCACAKLFHDELSLLHFHEVLDLNFPFL
jgi:hypothetical protein